MTTSDALKTVALPADAPVDITLPPRPDIQGAIHPVSHAVTELAQILTRIGFDVSHTETAAPRHACLDAQGDFTVKCTMENAGAGHLRGFIDTVLQQFLTGADAPATLRPCIYGDAAFAMAAQVGGTDVITGGLTDTGFAARIFTARLTAIKYGIADTADFSSTDPAWLRHYGLTAID